MHLSECTASENNMSPIMLVALMAHHTLNCNGQTGKQTPYMYVLLDQKKSAILQSAFNFNRAPAVTGNMGFKRPYTTG
jgi:hypothetical protein